MQADHVIDRRQPRGMNGCKRVVKYRFTGAGTVQTQRFIFDRITDSCMLIHANADTKAKTLRIFGNLKLSHDLQRLALNLFEQIRFRLNCFRLPVIMFIPQVLQFVYRLVNKPKAMLRLRQR